MIASKRRPLPTLLPSHLSLFAPGWFKFTRALYVPGTSWDKQNEEWGASYMSYRVDLGLVSWASIPLSKGHETTPRDDEVQELASQTDCETPPLFSLELAKMNCRGTTGHLSLAPFLPPLPPRGSGGDETSTVQLDEEILAKAGWCSGAAPAAQVPSVRRRYVAFLGVDRFHWVRKTGLPSQPPPLQLRDGRTRQLVSWGWMPPS